MPLVRLPPSRLPLAFAFGCLTIAGCARDAQVQAPSLPLTHVVIYRNGVGYFERSGHVEDSEVHFKMKETEVGDFLATLAVMERGGSSVKAAAFPLDVDDEVVKDDPEPSPDGGAPKRPPLSEDEKRGIKKVVLALDGKAHDLDVGYIASAPVWRPSYRLVVYKDGQADLQAWGIVQNLSGEDWKDVKLSLVAGAPLSFEAQLGTPVVPQRPTVTDQGEVIAAVPRAETSLSQEPPPPPPAPPAAQALKDVAAEESVTESAAPATPGGAGGEARRSKKAGMNGPAKPRPAPPPMAAAPAPFAGATSAPMMPRPTSAPRDLRTLAAVAVEAGTTRYDLPASVTVPDKSATMVMLLSKRVPGEADFLFAPDPGVPDSVQHPFRVARFANKTGGALERGPIAVFQEGSFLGQGMVDPLPDAATATVPFALERSLAIDSERKYDELGERVHQIENGELFIDRDAQTRTHYRVRNGADMAAKVLVKHPRTNGTRLVQPPPGTEDNVGTGSALLPTTVQPRATSELVVDERATLTRREDWFSPTADNAVKAFLADAKVNGDVVSKLRAAWAIRKEIVDKTQTRTKLAQEQASLNDQQQETRLNLKAIEKNKSADALRAKLTQRLADASSRADELTKQIVELDSKLAELRVQFKEGVRDLKWMAPNAS
ncbi:MAG TPA: hypothetical protein VGI39_10850 [Polyangiaceae bacterium]